MNFRSTHTMKTVEKIAANVKPGKVVSWKMVFVGSVVISCVMRAISWLGFVASVKTLTKLRPKRV